MIELYFVFNGYRKQWLGQFDVIGLAVEALKRHQASYSAITCPHFVKSRSGESIRIDYGARDCYYLLVPAKRKEIDDDRGIESKNETVVY